MAAELQNGVELRNSVDNSSAEAGLKQLESAAAETARKISDNAAKESARQARAEEAVSRASASRLKRRATMALAIGTAGLDMAGQGLRMAGQEEVGQALSGAAQGARELGTMLAPLGWQAAAVGAALGAAAGGIKSFVDATEEHRKRMEKIAQGLRDSGAAGAIEESHLSTPEERAEYQAAQRQKMADLQIKLDRGATISSADVLAAARWDKGLAQQLLARNTEQQQGKKVSQEISPLWYLYEMGEDELRYRAGRPGGGKWKNVLSAAESLGPEILATARSGTGYDPEADKLYAQMKEEREKGRLGTASGGSEEGGEGIAAPGRLSGARADALSAQGIGYTGNPMQETEKLLREIRDDARRRKPSDSGLLTA